MRPDRCHGRVNEVVKQNALAGEPHDRATSARSTWTRRRNADKPVANLSGKDVRTMWTLTLTNNYHSTVIATDNEGNHNVNPNSQYQNATALGNAYLTIPGLGQANFIDIADSHIGGDGPETWGVLINYQGEAWVFRYEGGGELSATLTSYGVLQISSTFSTREVELPPITRPES
jgi:hypothetical protein